MHLLKNEAGSIMVEFAFVSMILILLLVGIIEFGLVFNAQLSMENAVSSASRYIAMPIARTDGQIDAYIQSLVPNLDLDTNDIIISPTIRQRGQPFTLSITYQYPIPVTLGVLPQALTLKASVTAIQE